MSDNDTERAVQAELDELMHLARAGRLNPNTFARLDELNQRVAGADGAEASPELHRAAPLTHLHSAE